MKTHMRHRELLLLSTLSRTGSVTVAAQALGMSQPAASAMLRKMEERVGFDLFTRARRRLELTAGGRALLPEVVHALAALESVDRLAESMGRGGYRRLVIGAVPVVGASILPQAVRSLMQERPEVAVSLISGTALEIVDMVEEQRVELGIIFGSAVNEHIGARKLSLLPLCCVMRGDHPYAGKRSISVNDLAAVPYVGHSRRLPLGALTAQALEQRGLRYEPAVEVTQFSAACSFAEAGCGIAVVETLTALYAQSIGLVARRFVAPSDLALTMLWPLSSGLSSYARVLIDRLEADAAWARKLQPRAKA